MIATTQGFDEATAVERRILEWASSKARSPTRQTSTDLRDAQNTVVGLSGVSTSDGGRQAALREFRPLLFGTAWKVIDLLLEFAFHGLPGAPKDRWTIKEKQRRALAFEGSLAGGLTTNRDLWERVCIVYDATTEARHALVHRRLEVDGTGALINLNGTPKDVSAAEQDALQGLSLTVAESAIRQTCGLRETLVLGSYVNALGNIHARGALPSSADRPPPLIIVNADWQAPRWVFDARSIYDRAKSIHPGMEAFDLEVHLIGTTLPPIRGRLEQAAKDGVTGFDLAAQEPWMLA